MISDCVCVSVGGHHFLKKHTHFIISYFLLKQNVGNDFCW